MATDEESPRSLGGVTLEQFAGVTAATAEGIPLDLVLAQEAIPADGWNAAATSWREAIADAPALVIELVRLRRIAEDCLARKVTPLDDDPAAWVGLLKTLGEADDPTAVLASLGLTASDVSRIGRRWKARAREDRALEKTLTELGANANPPKAVDIGLLELRPFPWTPKPSAPAAPERAPRDEGRSPVAASSAAGVEQQAVARQLASFQLSQPGHVEQTEQTEQLDARQVLELLIRRPLPFVKGAPIAPPPRTAAGDSVDPDRGETCMADGAAIRATLASGAIPFSNAEDLARASVAGRVERFAAIQAAATRSGNLDATLLTFGLSKEAWELERRALASELASDPTLRAVYERAWREATSR